MALFKKATPKQKATKTVKRKKKESAYLKKLDHLAEVEERKARIEHAKSLKVNARAERLKQLPIVGNSLYGSNTPRPATRKRRPTKILGRGSGWKL